MEHTPPSSFDLERAEVWPGLFEKLGPQMLVLAIERRLSPHLRARYEPEDILQEAWLRTWRRRSSLEWRGIRSFRRLFLSIAEDTIRDLVDRETAAKRTIDSAAVPLSVLSAASAEPLCVEDLIYVSTTPGRLAALREEVRHLRSELQALPVDDREILSLRLIEEWTVDEIAAHTGFGRGAIKHRVRRSLLALSARLHALRQVTTV